MMSRSNFLSYNLEFCELKQQLFGTGITELNSGFRILACSFYARNRTYSKTLVFYT